MVMLDSNCHLRDWRVLGITGRDVLALVSCLKGILESDTRAGVWTYELLQKEKSVVKCC